MGLSRRRPLGGLGLRDATDDGPPPLLPPTRWGLYGWRPGKGMRPQMGEHCVEDTTEEDPTYMQSFIISHSSRVEQYGDMSSDSRNNTISNFLKMNWVIGSPPKFDTLLASLYLTYMHSFIISHSSCAEQYGDMSSEGLTHSDTHTFFKFNWVTGHHQTLTYYWHHSTRHTWKVS